MKVGLGNLEGAMTNAVFNNSLNIRVLVIFELRSGKTH